MFANDNGTSLPIYFYEFFSFATTWDGDFKHNNICLDDDASMCMMKECSRSFNILVRRHHCRNCGYVICNGCSGYAPVPSVRYESDRVCAACYDELQNKCEHSINLSNNVFFVQTQWANSFQMTC